MDELFFGAGRREGFKQAALRGEEAEYRRSMQALPFHQTIAVDGRGIHAVTELRRETIAP